MMGTLNFLLVLATCIAATAAFLQASPLLSTSRVSRHQFKTFGVQLSAKKRRRRTNDETNEVSLPPGDDLPEFDVDPESSSDTAAKSAESSSDDPFKITDAMIGKEGPVRSIKELITDRTLEKSFKFDEIAATGESLPDLSAFEIAAGAGKKKARKEARREAALKAKEEENVDLLKDVPPMFQGEDGKFSPVKVIETATWAGIFLLVGWEVYLNSPLFDRAAPLAPIVYQLVL